jgi:hypothetical protein
MASLEDSVEALEQQRSTLLNEKKILAQLEREAFSEHKKLEEDQLKTIEMLVNEVVELRAQLEAERSGKVSCDC